MKYRSDLERGVAQKKQNKKAIQKLKRDQPKKMDDAFRHAHEDVFEEIDCLECANCCKTTSPIFRDIDIERLSKRLKLSHSKFAEKYLRLDSDGDYVLQSSPCVFLQEDNKCSVYEDRPKACREYPHTDRKKMHQILDLTLRNTKVCPAVVRILEEIRSNL